MTQLLRFDIVRCLTASTGDQQVVGHEYVVESFHTDTHGEWLSLYNEYSSGISGGNSASRFELVYRPPTRPEVEAMREEIKRLRADVAHLTRNRDFWRGIAGHGEGEEEPECNS